MKPDLIVNHDIHQLDTTVVDERMTHIRDLADLLKTANGITNPVERERLENALRLERIFARRNHHQASEQSL